MCSIMGYCGVTADLTKFKTGFERTISRVGISLYATENSTDLKKLERALGRKAIHLRATATAKSSFPYTTNTGPICSPCSTLNLPASFMTP